MILTQDDIRTEIAAGRILVDPYDPEAVGPASIDLRLGNEIRIFSPVPQVISITHASSYKEITYKLELGDSGYVIKPGELVLGITQERITLPDDIAGWLSSRSRFARLGLMVHISAPFMQPGISNHQVLEIFNTGPNFLRLVPGERICQFVFDRCTGRATYTGTFANQQEGQW
ncbi:MAG: dCTP deaminase [Myxococcota bacterium]|mgnify:CR=1 FL=1|jgi:dCTP deaminase|nr:dCTP deaminase [Myxococcota bacterium]